MKISALQVGPYVVYAGEQVTCRLRFETKGAVYLENIAALLSAEEVYMEDAGSAVSTISKMIHKFTFVKPYREHLLARRWIEFVCVLPIPPDAPATFQAANNNISWSVRLKVTFKRWPSWEKKIPITVLPGYIP